MADHRDCMQPGCGALQLAEDIREIKEDLRCLKDLMTQVASLSERTMWHDKLIGKLQNGSASYITRREIGVAVAVATALATVVATLANIALRLLR